MFFVTLLAITATTVLALPVEYQAKIGAISLKRVSNVTLIKNVVYGGLARINKFNGATSSVSSGLVINYDISYVAPVSIGGKTWQLIVDTGSSNTWCGAAKPCEQTSTGKDTGGSVYVRYGDGSTYFVGEEYKDTVSFGGLTVSSQSIGAAFHSQGFNGVDGVFGLGPVALTAGTVSNAKTVPTFLDSLYSEGSIPTNVLGISFRPESGSNTNDANGELTFGGTDSSKYSGLITYFPKLTSSPFSSYWAISISSFTYGSTNLASSASGIVDTGTTSIPIQTLASGIVDTGTTLIYIPTLAYNNFLTAAGGKTDYNTTLASFTTQPDLNFGIEIESTTFHLTPSQYLIPVSQYDYFGLNYSMYYAWINDGGSSGINTILGQKFLENYYAVLDTTQSRIGFATGV